METTKILPELDLETLQQKANEFAMKGAIKTIEDFYTGYDSPYKKALSERMLNKGVDSSIAIPDIIGILNESISAEVDRIANNAVSKSFVPMLKKFLTRAESELKLSDILKEFINHTDFDRSDDKYNYKLEIIKDDGSFLYLKITNGEMAYEVHFYLKSDKNVSPKVYEIYTLPYYIEKESTYSYRTSSLKQSMKLSVDGVVLELPFTTEILRDGFVSYIAKLIIGNTKITFDVDGFDDDLFPEYECHCD